MHDPAQVDVTAEEFYEQTSYGKSSLDYSIMLIYPDDSPAYSNNLPTV